MPTTRALPALLLGIVAVIVMCSLAFVASSVSAVVADAVPQVTFSASY